MDKIKQITTDQGRLYEIEGVGAFPSVTTILGGTSDKSFLFRWRQRVGVEEANRISKYASGRGNCMHQLLEKYMVSEKKPRITKKWINTQLKNFESTGQDAKDSGISLFKKFLNDDFLGRVDETLANEVFLWSKVGFAGAVDNVSRMKDGSIKVIDFKSSTKVKREEWVQDYFLQVAAYSIAYWERTGTKPDGAEIWISTEPEEVPQNFKMTFEDIRHYFTLFKERLDIFNSKTLKSQ